MAQKLSKPLQKRNKELNQLTVESISEALLQLMQTKEYAKISVTDLCRKAGVSRNAFYQNFGTLDNVFKRIVLGFNRDVILRKLGNPFNQRTNPEWYVKFFQTVTEYAHLFQLIISCNLQHLYLGYVNDLLTDPKQDAVTRYRRLMWNGAIQNIIIDWIERGMPETPEEMAKICYEKLFLFKTSPNE